LDLNLFKNINDRHQQQKISHGNFIKHEMHTDTNKILPKRTKIGAKLPDHTNRPSPFSGSPFLNPKRTYFSTNPKKKNNTISTPQSTLNKWSHEKKKKKKKNPLQIINQISKTN
jgi:hypothetical protein